MSRPKSKKPPAPVGYRQSLILLREDTDRRGRVSEALFGRFYERFLDFYTRWGQWVLNRWPGTGYVAEDMVAIGMAATVTAVREFEPGTVSNSKNEKHRGNVVTLLRYVRWNVGNAMSKACRAALRWPPTERTPHVCGDPECAECEDPRAVIEKRAGRAGAKRMIPNNFATTGNARFDDDAAGGGISGDSGIAAVFNTATAMSGSPTGQFSLGFSSSAWFSLTPDMTLRMRDAVRVRDRLPREVRAHVLECLSQGMTVVDALECLDLERYGITSVRQGITLVNNWARRIEKRNATGGAA